MITLLYTLYVLVCLFLILVVLLQAGRGGMGAAFGGSSQTVFGGSGAGNFLTRLTVISAALFMILSATLTWVSSSGEKSLERASERIRQAEEARSAASKQSDSAKKAAATAPAAQSTPEGDGTAAPEAAPNVQVEGEEHAEPGAPTLDVGGTPIKLERVDPKDVPGLGKPAAPAGANGTIKLERVDPKDVPGVGKPAAPAQPIKVERVDEPAPAAPAPAEPAAPAPAPAEPAQ
jgi:preprotein translocase subunit SecG